MKWKRIFNVEIELKWMKHTKLYDSVCIVPSFEFVVLSVFCFLLLFFLLFFLFWKPIWNWYLEWLDTLTRFIRNLNDSSEIANGSDKIKNLFVLKYNCIHRANTPSFAVGLIQCCDSVERTNEVIYIVYAEWIDAKIELFLVI